jgi:hypothetical protein
MRIRIRILESQINVDSDQEHWRLSSLEIILWQDNL